MLLAVDVGNSNIVIGGMDGVSVRFLSRVETNTGRTADQYAVELVNIASLYDVKRSAFEGAILSCVVPPLTEVMRTAISRFIGKEPLIVGPGLKTGLNIKIDNPSQLGSDIVANAVAAITLYESPSVVIDMGTATTVSAIGKEQTFLGCAILPGFRIAADALVGKAAQLQSVALESPPNVIGTNTIDSIKSGVIYGAAAALEGMFERVNESMKEPARQVILTGGNARFIIDHLKKERFNAQVLYEPDLLMIGLATLYRKNTFV